MTCTVTCYWVPANTGEYIPPTALGRFQVLLASSMKLEIADSTDIARMVTDGVIEAG